jgi:hypothetical protein
MTSRHEPQAGPLTYTLLPFQIDLRCFTNLKPNSKTPVIECSKCISRPSKFPDNATSLVLRAFR